MFDLPEEKVEKIQVKPDGDRELWTVSSMMAGNPPFGWTLPLVCRRFLELVGPDNPARVFYYVHGRSTLWSHSQYEVLAPILDVHDHCPKDERGWWFTQEALEKFARKAPGMNPEYYVRWPGWEVPVTPPEEEEMIPGDIELEPEPGFSNQELRFLKKVHFMLGEAPYEQIKLFWVAFRKEALKWLAKDQKPLDLGFLQLIPMPYRANWKEALACRFLGLATIFGRRNSSEEREELLRGNGFYGAIASVKLLAIDHKDRFCHWTIEPLPSRALQERMASEEAARAKRMPPAAYANHVLGAISRSFKATMQILAAYVKEVSVPVARRLERGDQGAVVLVPDSRPGAVLPRHGICDRVDLALVDALKEFQDEERNLLPETPDVPPVPGVLAGSKDLRRLFGDKSGNGEANGARLRVLDDREGGHSGVVVLGEGPEVGRSGVAGRD